MFIQDVLLSHPLTSVLNVTREPDSATLMFTFRGDMSEFKVQVDSPAHAWEMVNVLEQCKGDRMVSATPSLPVQQNPHIRNANACVCSPVM